MEPDRRPHRPFVLRAIIALLIIQSIFDAAYVALSVWDYILLSDPLRNDPDGIVQLLLDVGSLSILAPLYLVAAIGLWRLRRWAWVLTMILLAYSMTEDIIKFSQGDPFYFSMALNVVNVAYLNLREVQDLFSEPTKKDASWTT